VKAFGSSIALTLRRYGITRITHRKYIWRNVVSELTDGAELTGNPLSCKPSSEPRQKYITKGCVYRSDTHECKASKSLKANAKMVFISALNCSMSDSDRIFSRSIVHDDGPCNRNKRNEFSNNSTRISLCVAQQSVGQSTGVCRI